MYNSSGRTAKVVGWSDHTVARYEDWEAALKAVKAYEGVVWKSKPGGEKGQRKVFRCASHEDCPVECRLWMEKTALVRSFH